ncbi:MAG: HAD family phosphatase [Candidatus Diapherotrites archaeon]|nr:HAD family phosphatase [Candidatus Diapherotrites archaeon]
MKIVFFDMEGVIFETGVTETNGNVAASIWRVLSESIGARDQDLKGKEIWNNNGFNNYFEWMEYIINVYKDKKLDRQHFFGVINKVQYIDGVKETFEVLKKKGYKTAIISGGFKNLADRAAKDLKINHVFAACELFFGQDEYISHYNFLPCDYKGKVDFMNILIAEYGCEKSQCGFVGDGVNDIHLAKEAGVSVAFNARKELQEVCTHSINQEKKNLRAILEFFP